MGYILCVDEVQIPITNFSESLSGDGNLNFSASAVGNNADFTVFASLSALREVMADGKAVLQVKENDAVVWEGNGYILANASISADESGRYFSAYFTTPSGLE